MKSSKEVAELIKKYIEGNISSEESIQLNNWIKEKPEHAEFFKSVLSEDEVFEDAFLWIDLKQKNENQWLDDLKKDTLDKIHNKIQTKSQSHLNGFTMLLLPCFCLDYF